ncbi:MAG: tRNA (adenosine(37)-N6)-threonylcarbamoyltransferase complex dimerization subunit type 1 TsaB [Clostridia bacterium]|nr:tRNA (adenosine(37)-N6)-threonylcarbamoyltransferase complex dimerization subunit type 1 TsaB [Clostridia bacterium]
MIILGVDSSATLASVAIAEDEKTIVNINLNHKRTHSEKLLDMINQALRLAQLTINDIDVFMVNKGPGSFTGLRIGIATVKGLCHAVNKPAVPVSTLDSFYYSTSGYETVCPIMDARRGEVYAAVYHKGEKVMEDTPIALSELLKKLDYEKILFLGDGVPVHRELIEKELGNRAEFECEHNNFGSAAAVIKAGLNEIKKNGTVDYNNLNPVYLRVSQAERLKK